MIDAPPVLEKTKNGYLFERYPHDRTTDASGGSGGETL